MPQTIVQFLVFAGVVAIGAAVSQFIAMPVFMRWHLKPEQLALDLGIKAGPEVTGTRLQGYVGTIEIIIYATAIVYDYPGFIAVWFATKYVSSWRQWGEDALGRTFYNRSLFGSGLSLLIGTATGGLARIAISYVATHYSR